MTFACIESGDEFLRIVPGYICRVVRLRDPLRHAREIVETVGAVTVKRTAADAASDVKAELCRNHDAVADRLQSLANDLFQSPPKQRPP